MGQQVVMERSWRASPLGTIASDTLLMASVIEAFVNDAPLQGGIMVVVHGDVLLATPAKAAMVDDDVLSILYADGSTFDKVLLL